ncbi:hypothetical protein NDU88_005320 [Pleurodeles waltl]|uniref:Uncharacterized protein n=1 Tax=Pleurodeles waltl TaxID=8319 RepID=A0AAV7MY06_PLEWA|nr:hypothetical protein NDU88_005320 [Pleurodeles waltl]
MRRAMLRREKGASPCQVTAAGGILGLRVPPGSFQSKVQAAGMCGNVRNSRVLICFFPRGVALVSWFLGFQTCQLFPPVGGLQRDADSPASDRVLRAETRAPRAAARPERAGVRRLWVTAERAGAGE